METVVYKVRDPQGREREIRGPAGASDAEIIAQAQRLFSRQNASAQIENDPITRGAKNFNADASFTDNLLSGAGKALSDVGLGVRQILREDVQGEVDDRAKRDRALMSTGGGLTGNIGTQVGMALLPGAVLSKVPATAAVGRAILSPSASLPGVLTGAATGAAQSAIQPVETGGSRAANAAVGGIAGAVVPTAMMAVKGGSAIVEPLYKGGRDRIVGRAINEAAGPNRSAVVNALSQAQEIVPGSLPTAAEASGNAGIASLQRTAAAVNPAAYAERALDQNAARVAAIRELAGDAGKRQFFEAARSSAADDLYKAAYQAGVDLRRNAATGQFLSKAEQAARKGEITKLLSTPALSDAVEQAKLLMRNDMKNVRNPSGSVEGLHYVRRALSDKISSAGPDEKRILIGLRDRLDTTLDTISPKYAEARVTFRDMSRPINQMEIGEHLMKKAGSPLPNQVGDPTLFPAAFGRATRDMDELARQATGFKGAKADKILDPEQIERIISVRQDLARALVAQNAGRGAGSDTVQKLAMTNIMQRSGLPTFLADLPGVSRAGKWVYGGTDDLMRERLAEALLDPKTTARLMDKATPSAQRKAVVEALTAAGKAGLLGSAAALNAPQ